MKLRTAEGTWIIKWISNGGFFEGGEKGNLLVRA